VGYKFLFFFFNFAYRSSNVLASPLQSPDMQIYGTIDQVPKEVECQGCPFLSYLELNEAKPAVEPKTGIEFPLVLDNIFVGEKNFGFNSEVNILFGKFSSGSFGRYALLYVGFMCSMQLFWTFS